MRHQLALTTLSRATLSPSRCRRPRRHKGRRYTYRRNMRESRRTRSGFSAARVQVVGGILSARQAKWWWEGRMLQAMRRPPMRAAQTLRCRGRCRPV